MRFSQDVELLSREAVVMVVDSESAASAGPAAFELPSPAAASFILLLMASEYESGYSVPHEL